MSTTFKITGPFSLPNVIRDPKTAVRMLELTNPDALVEGAAVKTSAFHRWITRGSQGSAFFALDSSTNLIVGQGLVLDETPNFRFGVFVDPEYRRQKLGSMLYLAAKAEFGSGLFVSPQDTNYDGGVSRLFYKKLGAL